MNDIDQDDPNQLSGLYKAMLLALIRHVTRRGDQSFIDN